MAERLGFPRMQVSKPSYCSLPSWASSYRGGPTGGSGKQAALSVPAADSHPTGRPHGQAELACSGAHLQPTARRLPTLAEACPAHTEKTQSGQLQVAALTH